MDFQRGLELFGRMLLSGADTIGMLKAGQQRLADEAGIDLEVPRVPSREVTDKARRIVLRTHKGTEKSVWLRPNGPRDQLCVRFGITREQIAGVLAAATKKTNGGPRPEPVEELTSEPAPVPSVEPDPPYITPDPKSWPVRQAKTGSEFPTRTEREYEIDEIDVQIVGAVLSVAASTWPTVRHDISRIRRLTGQQVAWLKADRTSRLKAAA